MIIRSDETADLPVPDAPGVMRMHLFRPAGAGRFPGVLFFSEIYQVTDPIRRLAAIVAGLGYIVAVPDLSIEVDNLDEIHQRVLAAGLAVEYGPVNEPWGVRRFYVRDPFNRLVNILQHSEVAGRA